MLKHTLPAILLLAVALVLFVYAAAAPVARTDVVSVNAVVQEVERAGGRPAEADVRDLPSFAVLSAAGDTLYRSCPGLSEDVLTAIRCGDIVVPVQLGTQSGTVLIPRTGTDNMMPMRIAAAAAALTGLLLLAQYGVLRRRILLPFRAMQHTAKAIAAGDLDAPFRMDKDNVFGAFTESFDLMRQELSRAQAAEKKANDERKELIAKLSHDLRTPVAAISAAAELGVLRSADARDRREYEKIARKAVHINLLLSNLLSAAVEEQTQISVAVRDVPKDELTELIDAADFLHYARDVRIPACTVRADPVRLLQILDNIFSNVSKYGRAPVSARGYVSGGELILEIEDAGGGVPDDEAGLLHTRYFRGSNAEGLDGAGLGLYICTELACAMGGELLVGNGDTGLRVTIVLPLARPALRKS